MPRFFRPCAIRRPQIPGTELEEGGGDRIRGALLWHTGSNDQHFEVMLDCHSVGRPVNSKVLILAESSLHRVKVFTMTSAEQEDQLKFS
jgi:hypothetical protein